MAARDTTQTLRTAAANNGLLFGAATMTQILQSDGDFAREFARQCGLLVPENELKWETVEPEPGHFDFAAADYLADFAASNGMLFRGHCLAWHQQTPNWAGNGTKEQVTAQLTRHISETVGHYAGHVHSWDVVNEAVEPNDGRSDGLRSNRWLRALGPDYIDLAFRAAAEADPNAMLVLNDYDMECDSADAYLRRAAVLQLLTRLKAKGTPVHALGIQAHLSGSDFRFSTTQLKAFMKAVADLGLKILITELDVRDNHLPADIATRDEAVASVYQQFLSTVLEEPAVAAILTWGLSDRYTWLGAFAKRDDGKPVRPLPLDSDLQPKLATQALLAALEGAAR
jgi:endo-1,4-beta-xylanase